MKQIAEVLPGGADYRWCAKNIGNNRSGKQLDHRCIVHPLRSLFVSFIFLFFQFFGEITFSVAFQLGTLPVFTQNLGDVVSVYFKIRDRSPWAERGQHD